jgi:hypothetical protein
MTPPVASSRLLPAKAFAAMQASAIAGKTFRVRPMDRRTYVTREASIMTSIPDRSAIGITLGKAPFAAHPDYGPNCPQIASAIL